MSESASIINIRKLIPFETGAGAKVRSTFDIRAKALIPEGATMNQFNDIARALKAHIMTQEPQLKKINMTTLNKYLTKETLAEIIRMDNPYLIADKKDVKTTYGKQGWSKKSLPCDLTSYLREMRTRRAPLMQLHRDD